MAMTEPLKETLKPFSTIYQKRTNLGLMWQRRWGRRRRTYGSTRRALDRTLGFSSNFGRPGTSVSHPRFPFASCGPCPPRCRLPHSVAELSLVPYWCQYSSGHLVYLIQLWYSSTIYFFLPGRTLYSFWSCSVFSDLHWPCCICNSLYPCCVLVLHRHAVVQFCCGHINYLFLCGDACYFVYIFVRCLLHCSAPCRLFGSFWPCCVVPVYVVDHAICLFGCSQSALVLRGHADRSFVCAMLFMRFFIPRSLFDSVW